MPATLLVANIPVARRALIIDCLVHITIVGRIERRDLAFGEGLGQRSLESLARRRRGARIAILAQSGDESAHCLGLSREGVQPGSDRRRQQEPEYDLPDRRPLVCTGRMRAVGARW
jgi:hypothetical protein